MNIPPLNTIRDKYIPHFTLFNFFQNQLNNDILISRIPKNYIELLSTFSLQPALGKANDNWEMVSYYEKEHIC